MDHNGATIKAHRPGKRQAEGALVPLFVLARELGPREIRGVFSFG